MRHVLCILKLENRKRYSDDTGKSKNVCQLSYKTAGQNIRVFRAEYELSRLKLTRLSNTDIKYEFEPICFDDSYNELRNKSLSLTSKQFKSCALCLEKRFLILCGIGITLV